MAIDTTTAVFVFSGASLLIGSAIGALTTFTKNRADAAKALTEGAVSMVKETRDANVVLVARITRLVSVIETLTDAVDTAVPLLQHISEPDIAAKAAKIGTTLRRANREARLCI
jgi:hypothetical protein